MIKTWFIFFVFFLEIKQVHGNNSINCNKYLYDGSSIYILNNSQLEEFYRINYDTITYLYIDIKEQLKSKYKFENIKYLKKLTIYCKDFNDFEPFSSSLFGSLESFELYIKNLNVIPSTFKEFNHLEKFYLDADSCSIEDVKLETFLSIASLKDLSFNSKTLVKKVSLGGNASNQYNNIQIGTKYNHCNIQSICFDSSFFNQNLINSLNLRAQYINNFNGSNSFVVFQLTLQCYNIRDVIYAMNLNNLELLKSLHVEQITSISISDFSDFEAIPKKLLECNFRMIKLFKANRLKSISNIDYNTSWPLYIKLYDIKGSKEFYSTINQNKLLNLYIVTDKVKFQWVKNINRIGGLEIRLKQDRRLSKRISKRLSKL